MVQLEFPLTWEYVRQNVGEQALMAETMALFSSKYGDKQFQYSFGRLSFGRKIALFLWEPYLHARQYVTSSIALVELLRLRSLP